MWPTISFLRYQHPSGHQGLVDGVCTNLLPLLQTICDDISDVPIGRQDLCLGRPNSSTLHYQTNWPSFISCAKSTQKLDFDDTTVPCTQCFSSVLRHIAADEPFSSVTTATLRIGSPDTLEVTEILPSTLSYLCLVMTYDVDVHTLVDRVVRRFVSLSELYLHIRRPEHSHDYALSAFLSAPRTLKKFRFEDSLPVRYTEVDLETFLHMHPQLTSLHLNPYPSVTVQPAELPHVTCLDVVSRQASHTLAEFGALLQLSERITPRNASPSRLQVLDIGRSPFFGNSTHFIGHLRRIFPEAHIRSSSAVDV
ncbi:hypothetical protein PHLGIDRAFT_135733 [Phlebiopsis gigantea 11061_1 CR5-6]|uniref:F-box domain-containing protein n=1 Tax=Phlebiopsis gigantea (strain 11061_1 CR5-6) TaxID=745531 RepID=A0A0C3P4A0_PHLG1|nr:hypothetical protein PHLGIDRAFT_135733 [Phlebiopsis gigantea 11061_1 CR5-6]